MQQKVSYLKNLLLVLILTTYYFISWLVISIQLDNPSSRSPSTVNIIISGVVIFLPLMVIKFIFKKFNKSNRAKSIAKKIAFYFAILWFFHATGVQVSGEMNSSYLPYYIFNGLIIAGLLSIKEEVVYEKSI